MDEKELFSFDIRGFLVLRGGALDAVSSPGDEAAAVLASPLLRQYVRALVNPGSAEGEGVVVDTPPAPLPQISGGGALAAAAAGDLAAAGDIAARAAGERVISDGSSGDERRWTTRIGSDSVVRYAQGLRVVVALCDCPAGAGGLTVVPNSHNSGLPTAPPEVLAFAPELQQLCHQPELAAGDCVLMASNLVAFMRPWNLPTPQRLLSCEFISPQTRPSAGIPPCASHLHF